MKRRRKATPLSEQMKSRAARPTEKGDEFPSPGSTEHMTSTGSTLLDLAISGGRVEGGGIPGGIMVEIFGPSSSGKTSMLSEIAGGAQRAGGEVIFHDPEARLYDQFAKIFDLNTKEMKKYRPNTVPEVFKSIRDWKPKSNNVVNVVCADSLAALSTDLEMSKEEGDKMGGRRAKEFSEELRKTCRILAEQNYLLVCSNQLRQSMNAYGPKYKSPGGEAIAFYSSLRLRTDQPRKIKKTITYKGREYEESIGVTIQVEVHKSSVWVPYRSAPLTILWDYGIDDIRENLQFVKSVHKHPVFYVGNTKLDKSRDTAILIVERDGLQNQLRQEVIALWSEINEKFATGRKPKER